MKRLILFFFFINLFQSAFPQKVYFLYIQSESEQPFYVKKNGKIYSSAAKGYLILSKLYDSSYSFSVGFPGNKSTEQKFLVSMKGKDHGYLLKSFGEKGWGLFDLQTMSVQMAHSDLAASEIKKEPVKKDESEFTRILAKASDDSTLLEKPDLSLIQEENKDTVAGGGIVQPALKTEEKKNDTVEIKPVKEEEIEQPPVQKKETVQDKKESEKPALPELYKKSEIKRNSENSATEGISIVFIDEYSNGAKDTIRILIPQSEQTTQPVKSEIKGEKKFLDLPDTTKQMENEVQKEIKPAVEMSVLKSAVKTNNCQSVADENDFLKLRKKMAAESGDDDMVAEARRVFKTKCFTAMQLKNLSSLFLNDAGKYKFFDAAYSFVSDVENFTSLQSELKDEYYINRFKVMLR